MKAKKSLSKKQILISVMIPAYNEEKNLGRCLTALKNQNFPKENYEILVVNNASTDKTGEIAKKMGVRLVEEKRKGYGYALKKGFAEARADLVAVTDADTVAPPDWLSKIYQAFAKDKQVVMVGGRTVLRPAFPLALISQVVLNLVSGCLFRVFPGYTMAFRKEAYQKVGGVDTRFNFNIDTDLCLRVKKLGKTVFLYNNPLIVSSRHYRGLEGLKYVFKGAVNFLGLVFFRKTPFYHFGDVRE